MTWQAVKKYDKTNNLQYCSVRTVNGGVVAPSPRLDFAATQIWYNEFGYNPSNMYWVTGGSKLLWLVNCKKSYFIFWLVLYHAHIINMLFILIEKIFFLFSSLKKKKKYKIGYFNMSLISSHNLINVYYIVHLYEEVSLLYSNKNMAGTSIKMSVWGKRGTFPLEILNISIYLPPQRRYHSSRAHMRQYYPQSDLVDAKLTSWMWLLFEPLWNLRADLEHLVGFSPAKWTH